MWRIRILALAFAMTPGLATALEESAVAVPSGMSVTFVDSSIDSGTSAQRFRFLAPQIGGPKPLTYDEVAPDMQHLCDNFALPRATQAQVIPPVIVISLMEEPLEVGVTSPGIRQYFEAYSPQNGVCLWEAF
ncbi:DUF6497 family protein [Salipiger mangrovisoli]|nr:DUF6497 family protein [Salipiger mangrovisoli]